MISAPVTGALDAIVDNELCSGFLVGADERSRAGFRLTPDAHLLYPEAIEQRPEVMTRLLAGADQGQNSTVGARQGYGCDRGRRCGASRGHFPTVQDSCGRSGVGVKHHDHALMPREPAVPVLRVHRGDLGPEEHRPLQHSGHHAEHVTLLITYGHDEAIRLLGSPR